MRLGCYFLGLTLFVMSGLAGCQLGTPQMPLVTIDPLNSAPSSASISPITEKTAKPADSIIRIHPGAWAKTTKWSSGGPFYSFPHGEDNRLFSYSYGSGYGQFAYSFANPFKSTSKAYVSARLSSAHPQAKAPSSWVSDVTLIVNGKRYTPKRVCSDDGQGRIYSWELKHQHLRPFNTLCFAVEASSQYAHGVVIYHQSVDATRSDAPITVRIWK